MAANVAAGCEGSDQFGFLERCVSITKRLCAALAAETPPYFTLRYSTVLSNIFDHWNNITSQGFSIIWNFHHIFVLNLLDLVPAQVVMSRGLVW